MGWKIDVVLEVIRGEVGSKYGIRSYEILNELGMYILKAVEIYQRYRHETRTWPDWGIHDFDVTGRSPVHCFRLLNDSFSLRSFLSGQPTVCFMFHTTLHIEYVKPDFPNRRQ